MTSKVIRRSQEEYTESIFFADLVLGNNHCGKIGFNLDQDGRINYTSNCRLSKVLKFSLPGDLAHLFLIPGFSGEGGLRLSLIGELLQ